MRRALEDPGAILYGLAGYAGGDEDSVAHGLEVRAGVGIVQSTSLTSKAT
jgi:hypothetical protein